MKKVIFRPDIYVVILLIVTILGCNKEDLNKPIVTNSNPPGVVTNVTVLNQNGKATLTYTLPGDKDLLYVKAEYETTPGHSKEVKASYYINKLVLDGFGDTLAHAVKVYAVNSSEVSSVPVSVNVKPLTPSFLVAYRSLKVTTAFGGPSIFCVNPSKDNLAIVPVVDTTGTGKFVQTQGLDNIYSAKDTIRKIFRGQPSKLRKYGFFVRDRWLNQSDTFFVSLTPIFEIKLDKSEWRGMYLPKDLFPYDGGCVIDKMIDGIDHGGWYSEFYADGNTIQGQSGTEPAGVTIDLGNQHTFSRFMIFFGDNGADGYFADFNPRIFQIWFSNSPNPDGSYDSSWTMAGEYTVIQPSGGAKPETNADVEAAYNGFGFDFPANLPAYKYVRVRCMRNFSGGYGFTCAEFSLWGK